MWTHNASWGLIRGMGEGVESRPPWLLAVGAVLGAVGVVTVVLNLFLLAAILLHPPARSRSFHLHIVNMAVAAVLQGGGVLPLWTHYLIHGSWLHGDAVCRWWLSADTMASTVTALALVVTASDRFIYLICWRFVKEGGKYVFSFLLIFLSWLLALTLTLTLTLMETDAVGARMGVQNRGLCNWGPDKGKRMAAARLVVYAVGAGLGTGLCLALIILPCLGRGDLLPIDEDDAEVTVRNRNLLTEEERKRAALSVVRPPLEEPMPLKTPIQAEDSIDILPGKGDHEEEEDGDDEDFPRFLFVKKTDRLEERERWKWQVTSLLTVTAAWALLWMPSHLFVFADKLGLHWSLTPEAVVASIVLGYSHAAIMPLLWMLHQPLRAALAALVTCRCCRDEDDDDFDDDSVEFQDVGPYRQPPSAPERLSPSPSPPPPVAASSGGEPS